ncbi:MAG: hypothetical protein K6G82_08845 [Ruminococcus sp.]|nr:hypothetical protein [Ruminococcus sp.]
MKEFKEKLRKNNYILEDEPVPEPKKENKTVGKNDLKTGRKTVLTTTSIEKIKPKKDFTK